MAMVYVAREDLETAAQVVNEGVAVLDMAGTARSRFPASGLQWLAGSIRLLRDDVEGALTDFSRELEHDAPGLYAAEFSVAALNGRGFAHARAGQAEQAEAAFRHALAANHEQARSHILVWCASRARLADRWQTPWHPTSIACEMRSHSCDGEAERPKPT
jgi:hypothetical protein